MEHDVLVGTSWDISDAFGTLVQQKSLEIHPSIIRTLPIFTVLKVKIVVLHCPTVQCPCPMSQVVAAGNEGSSAYERTALRRIRKTHEAMAIKLATRVSTAFDSSFFFRCHDHEPAIDEYRASL
jgi:hypothetical protein